jgi:hypothetical protein
VRPMVQGRYESLQISSGVEGMPSNWHILRWQRNVVDDTSMPEDRLRSRNSFVLCYMLMVVLPHVRHHMDEWWATLKPSGNLQKM